MSLSATLNQATFDHFIDIKRRADSLDIIASSVGKATVLDFAVGRSGNLEAGLELARLCFGGRGDAKIVPYQLDLQAVEVQTESPLEACIACQYAGWQLTDESYFAMCSGPIRIPRGREEILKNHGIVAHPSEFGIGILEANEIPPESIIEKIVHETGISPENIGLCVARTASYPGSLQVVARSIETTMHKLHELGFDLRLVRAGKGIAPIPPIAQNDMTSLGWTNDSILYGASVEISVDTDDQELTSIIDKIPSSSSADFGTPFLELFKRYNFDFYAMDKLLFSPAHVVVSNLRTGTRFEAGKIREDILADSFNIS